ncbi:peroxide stress protein YaaA [Calidifontibacter sp. DB0510]|uniref:Peroxide stress protein YaaA n=1 Tax=Metallococcus carri TaxID=1656884 RepID=A0A967B1Z7_9MICO|nr:peroxide stress protein YaaA [Metallococcus carri]NHN57351.1 peroxide stress protein YaaA [Metallococcus carri]NOP39129.1 peroxide stress protein YaaA [Calidifontibacter sp. DB2511S]
MLILLPPSETKCAATRGRPLDLARLSSPELTNARSAVIDALTAVSARDDACEVLGVSPGVIDQVRANLRLRAAPAAPAERVYDGVLYDALGLTTLHGTALRRARRQVVVQSALFGALRPGDRVPAYRLSMGTHLPPLGPLASFWRDPLAAPMRAAASAGPILDCRSSTYAAAWQPPADLADRWVQVRVPGATHMAKHTRGLVARALLELDGTVRRVRELPEALEGFETALTPPARPGRAWVLDASVR